MRFSFTTDDGVPVPTVSVAQMREIDRIAIENETPNLFQMMENAGSSLAGLIMNRLGARWSRVPISVFVGSGGNGGGGTVAARHLANRGGDITLTMSREPLSGSVLDQQLGVYSRTSGRVGDAPIGATGLIVDALVGYGLEDAPRGPIAEMIASINEADAPVVSLDVPSGLDGDTGQAPGVAVTAQETLTLALPKPGLSAPEVGELSLADLGIPVGVFRQIGVKPSPGIFRDGPVVHLKRRRF
jgi:NAD(P)H-hydrate epimerase